MPGWEKSSAQLQPAQACHARLVLNKTVTFLRTTLYILRNSGQFELLKQGSHFSANFYNVWVILALDVHNID